MKAEGAGGRRRWLWVVTGVLLVLAVLVLLAPLLLSLGPVRRLVLARVNAAGPAVVAVESWRLSWRGPIEVQGLEYRDRRQGMEARVAEVRSSAGLLALLRRHKDLGDVLLRRPDVVLEVAPQAAGMGETPPVVADPRERPVTVPSSGPRPPAPEAPAARRPAFDVAARVTVEEGRLRARQAGSGVWLSDVGLGARAEVTSLRAPMTLHLTVTQPAQDGRAAGLLVLEARAAVGAGAGGGPAVAGTLELVVEQLALETLAPLRALLPGLPAMSGLLDGRLTGSLAGVQDWQLQGQLAVGAWRIPDWPVVGDGLDQAQVRLNLDVKQGAEGLAVQTLRLESPLLELTGTGAVVTVTGATPGQEPAGRLQVVAELRLVDLARQFPGALHLQDGLKVEGGRLAVDTVVELAAGVWQARGQARMQDFAARRGEQPIVIKEMLTLEADLRYGQPGGLDVRVLDLLFPGGRLRVSGGLASGLARLELALGEARAMLGQIVALGALEAQGALGGLARWGASGDGRTRLEMLLTLKDVKASQVRWGREAYTFQGGGRLRGEALVAGRAVDSLNGSLKLEAVQVGGGALAARRIDVLAVERLAAEVTAETRDGWLVWNGKGALMGVHPGPGPATFGATLVTQGEVSASGGGLRKVEVTVEGLPSTLTLGIASIEGAGAERVIEGVRLGVKGELRDTSGLLAAFRVLDKPFPFLAPYALEVAGDMTGGTVALRELKLTSDLLSLSGRGEVKTGGVLPAVRLEGRIGGNWDRLAMLALALTGKPLAISGTFDREYKLDMAMTEATAANFLSTTEAMIGLGIARLVHLGVEVRDVVVDVEVSAGRAVAALDTKCNGGRLALRPELASDPGGVTLRIPTNTPVMRDVALNDAMASELLARLHPVLRGALVSGGVVDLTLAHFTMPLGVRWERETAFEGELRMRDVVFTPAGPLKELAELLHAGEARAVVSNQVVTFVCRDGRVYPSPLALKIGKVEVEVAGSTGLDQTLRYEIRVPVTEALVGSDLFPYVRGVVLRLPVEGRISKPEFSAEGLRRALRDLREDALKRAGGEGVRRALEGLIKR